MRGIAALLVLVTHAAGIAVTGNRASSWFTLTGLFGFDNFGAIGVDLFFIISGFVMAYAVAPKAGLKPAVDFLVMRWVRVAPPYLLASIVMLAVGMLVVHGYWGVRSFFNLAFFVPWLDTASYSVPPLYIGWTLSFEVSFYLLVALMVAVRLSQKITWLAGGIVVMVVLGQCLPNSPFIVRWFTNPILLEFALGIVAYVLWKSGLLMRRRWAWAVAGVIGGAVLVPQALSGTIPMAKMEFIVDNSLSLQRVMMWGLPMFFIFLSVLAFDRVRSGRLSYLSAKLGDASYSLYLAHIPAILGLTVVLGLVPFTIAPDAVFILCIAVGLLAGFLYYRHVERPMKTYLEHRAASLLLGDGRMARRPVQR